MPIGPRRYYGQGHLHFITCSSYQRLPALASPQHRNTFVEILSEVRDRHGFALLGYVVMPEHFHLLMGEPAKGNPSMIMQVLKQAVSHRILEEARSSARGSRLLRLLQGTEASGRPGEVRFWQPRFYDFNVWSEKKRLEKLDYMHHNPVTRGLVKHPKDWPWSSYRFYAFGDARMLKMDCW